MYSSAVSVAIILLTPLLASSMNLAAIAGNIGVRLLLVGWVIYSVRCGPLEGLLAVLAAATVISERSHQILTSFPLQQPKFPRGAGQGGVPQMLAAEAPRGEAVHYEAPQNEEGVAVTETHGEVEKEALYEAANDVQDSNPRIREVAQGEAAASFYEQKGLV